MKTPKHLPPLLKETMRATGYTQSTLASATSNHQPAISRWATGKITPTAGWIDIISSAMGLSDEQRVALHRAAAKDAGYDIDLK